MESRRLPFSRIRLNALEYHDYYCIAHGAPDYPPEASIQGTEGTVILDAVVGKDGQFLTLTVHRGETVLAEAAIRAVRHWEHRPVLLNGIPVEVQTQIEVRFQL